VVIPYRSFGTTCRPIFKDEEFKKQEFFEREGELKYLGTNITNQNSDVWLTVHRYSVWIRKTN
jgi:hypothetical protein